jgi:hypothetical protein
MITWHSLSMNKDMQNNKKAVVKEDHEVQKKITEQKGNPVLRYLQAQAAEGANILQWDYRLQSQADSLGKVNGSNKRD